MYQGILSRIVAGVDILGVQHPAAVGVDDDRGVTGQRRPPGQHADQRYGDEAANKSSPPRVHCSHERSHLVQTGSRIKIPIRRGILIILRFPVYGFLTDACRSFPKCCLFADSSVRAAIGAVTESSETAARWALGRIGGNLSTQGASAMRCASSVMFCGDKRDSITSRRASGFQCTVILNFGWESSYSFVG